MKYLCLFLLLFISSFLGCNQKVPGPKEVHIQIDCRIMDKEFQFIKSFPGDYCAFFSSGEWVSLTGKVIDLHSKSNQLRLHFPQIGHDEIKLSRDEKKIFFLSSEIREFKGKSMRFDAVNISDKDGAFVAKWALFEHLDELSKKFDLKNIDFAHLNTIHEIPKNDLEKKFPYMKEGNLLVTFNGLGSVVIFDPELNNVEFVYHILKKNFAELKDGQIISNGHLLIYSNKDLTKHSHTSINEYDMQQDKSVWSLDSIEAEYGSAQMLSNNNIFFTENSNNIGRMIEVNPKGKVVRVQLNDILDSRTKKPVNIYRARKLNLESFLENNY